MPPTPPSQAAPAIPWIGIVFLALFVCALVYWAFSATSPAPTSFELPPVTEQRTEVVPQKSTSPRLAPKGSPGAAPSGSPTQAPTIQSEAQGASAALAQASDTQAEIKDGDNDEYGNRWDARLSAWISPEGFIWDDVRGYWKDEYGNHWDEKNGTWASPEGFLWDTDRETWKDEHGNYWDSRKETWVSPEGFFWDGTKGVWRDEHNNYWDEKLAAWVSPDGFRWDGKVWRDAEENYWDEKERRLMNSEGTMYWAAEKETWISLDGGVSGN